MKIHLAVFAGSYYWALCTKPWLRSYIWATTDTAKVTCKKCLKIIEKEQGK